MSPPSFTLYGYSYIILLMLLGVYCSYSYRKGDESSFECTHFKDFNPELANAFVSLHHGEFRKKVVSIILGLDWFQRHHSIENST